MNILYNIHIYTVRTQYNIYSIDQNIKYGANCVSVCHDRCVCTVNILSARKTYTSTVYSLYY